MWLIFDLDAETPHHSALGSAVHDPPNAIPKVSQDKLGLAVVSTLPVIATLCGNDD